MQESQSSSWIFSRCERPKVATCYFQEAPVFAPNLNIDEGHRDAKTGKFCGLSAAEHDRIYPCRSENMVDSSGGKSVSSLGRRK
jgi:hypothetical protein